MALDYFLRPAELAAREQRHRDFMQKIRLAGEYYRLNNNIPDQLIEEIHRVETGEYSSQYVSITARIIRLSTPISFAMLALRQDCHIDHTKLLNEVGQFRFSTLTEILEVTGGLEPSAIAPVGPFFFPGIFRLFVDYPVTTLPTLRFKAAHPDCWVMMSGKSYKRFVSEATIVDISK